MSEDSLIETRKNKHQEINGGVYPLPTDKIVYTIAAVLSDIDYLMKGGGDYPLRIPTTIDLNEARGNGTRILHGRISALRKSGALTFIKLTDNTGSIQLVAVRNNLPDYDKLKLLDLGDIVEVTGEVVLTKTGERSLLLSEWKVLTKAHRPPPEKFAGITDTELKYRKRYLDLMSSEDTKSLFIIRSLVFRSIRSSMEQMGFIEVETPTFNTINSGANAKPFTTHHNSLDMDLYLRIAPELYLKRLLVGGFDKVFEIGKSYRNEGLSTRHNPEFSMIEFYEAYGSFESLFDYATHFINNADNYIRTRISDFNNYSKEYYSNCLKDRTFTLNTFKRVKIIDAVRLAMAKASLTTGDDFSDVFTICNAGNERLPKIDLKSLHYELDKCLSVGQRIGVLFEYVAEPFLTDDYRTKDGKYSCPVFITDYPSELCPLARPQDNNSDFCDRFELYIDGRELCNAYQELNDPDLQAERFRDQLQINDKDPMDYDADYIEALQHGMPPAIGFGMGIDRLVMLLTGAPSIKDVILFPTLKPVKET